MLSPENRAVLIKSLSRMVKLIERTCRAGQGQLNTTSTPPIRNREAVPFVKLPSRMRMGRDGMTMKVSASSIITRSARPPCRPAARPTSTPMAVASTATNRPMRKEFWIELHSSQKMSWPKLLVPRKCSMLGFRLLG